MNYILADIRTYLLSQNYTDIYIDYVTDNPETNSSIQEGIFLISEPSPTLTSQGGLINRTSIFSLYVRRGDPEQARVVSEEILHKLATIRGTVGTLASGNRKINYIETLTPPYLYGINANNGLTEFISRYSVQYVDSDFTAL